MKASQVFTIFSLLIVLLSGAIFTLMILLPVKDTSPFAGRMPNPGEVKIMVIGDSGEGDFRQRRVAALLEAECRDSRGDVFVQTVGDNFYPDSVTDTADPQWWTKFELIYDTPCLMQTRFFPTLGNHDYVLDPDAQVAYGREEMGSGRWTMPARFFEHKHGDVDGAPLATVVVLDTMQPIADQTSLLKRAFSPRDDSTWKIVVGHFNVRTYSAKYHKDEDLRNDLLPTLKSLRVDFYLSGHSHNLQLIEAAAEPVYIISGGGGASPRELIQDDLDRLRYATQNLGFVSLTLTPETADISIVETSGKLLSEFTTTRTRFAVKRSCLRRHFADSANCVVPQ